MIKVNDLPQKITMIEYCSTLGKQGMKYVDDKTKKEHFTQ